MMDNTINRASLLMIIDPEPVAAVVYEKSSELQLREQVAALTEQVATLIVRLNKLLKADH